MRRHRATARLRLGGEGGSSAPARFESRIFSPGGSEEPGGRSRLRALAVGMLLALLIHAGVLASLLWRAELAPIREKLLRVILFAPRAAETAAPPPAAAAPAPAPLPPVPKPAIARAPRPLPRPSAAAPEPAPPSDAPASDTAADRAAPIASATAPGDRVTTSARPRYKHNPEPPYPALALRRRQEGVVLLMVRDDAAGRPESVAVRTSSGFRMLDEAAVEAVRAWEFEPGRRDGEPVASQVEVPIEFQLERR
jgi:protein TonB